MEQDELGGCFVVSVEELGHNGLWSCIKDFLEARAVLQNVLLTNKVGQEVFVDNLPVQYVLSTDKRLLRLKPFSHSPVTWFRNPYAHVILVSTAEANDYKLTVRNMISKVVADLEREWGGATLTCEWIILYIRPFELDVNDRNAKRVFEKLRDDFGRKKRERCVRLDVPSKAFDALGRRMPALGLEDLEVCLKEAVQASFDSRQAAYDEEVKKLVEERLEPAWSFTTLYLVKDSFALMLECAGMLDDALREYMELEMCYLEALQRKAVVSPDFGANNENDDMAQILTASWRTTRRAVLKRNGIPEFSFRQYLFAAQARLLLKLGRLLEVGERGLYFINSMMLLLAEKQQQGVVRPYLRETWSFSACLVLVATISASVSQPDPAQEELATYLSAARSGSMAGTSPDGRSQSQLPALRPPASTAPQTSTPAGVSKPMDWDLGLTWYDSQGLSKVPVMGGKSILPGLRGAQGAEAQQREVVEKMLYRLLGHMYLLARQQLLALGAAVSFVGPLQSRPNIILPPQLQGFLDPSFGSLSSLTASYHPRTGLAEYLAASNTAAHAAAHSTAATPRSVCSSPRSDIRLEGAQGTPPPYSTPEPNSRTSNSLPPPSPASMPPTSPIPDPASTAENAGVTGNAEGLLATPRSAAAGCIGDFSSPGHVAAPIMNGEAAVGLVLRSISEWRLRAALERQESFDDLVQSLTSLTMWCFARAAHWRSAALYSLEQAAMLLQRGMLEAGSAVLEQTIGRLEGWGLLHGYLLPHLLAVQVECKHPNLAISLTKLLTLPPTFLTERNRPLFSHSLKGALDKVAASLDMSTSQWGQQQFVVAHTVPHTCSRLCGVHEDSRPLLAPPPRPPATGKGLQFTPLGSRDRSWGACQVCAGDRSYVWLKLHNRLEVDLELSQVVLVLGLLQPLAPATRVPGSGLHRQSSGSLVSGSGWQDAQDVVCQHITLAPSDGSLPSPSSWHTSAPSCVHLRPGTTNLVATFVPTQDGLYTLKHVAASLGGMKLHIPVLRPEEQTHLQLANNATEVIISRDQPPFLRSVIPATDLSVPPAVWGAATRDGCVAEEMVVLAVETVRQRVECGVAAVGGRLVGGVHPQWLGLLLLPKHDTLQQLVVRLGVRLSSSDAGDKRVPAISSSSNSSNNTLGDRSETNVELFSGLQRAMLLNLEQLSQSSEEVATSGSAAAGHWVPAARGTLDLSQHTLIGPALLWMQVSATYPCQGVEVVKVQRAGNVDSSARHGTLMYNEQLSDNRRIERSCSLNVDVCLEYVCGCPRAHTSVLRVPLHSPVHLHLQPTQISSNTTALQVLIQCGLLRGVTITRIELTPQVGLKLSAHVGQLAELLPLHLSPTATANVTLLLQTGITGDLPAQQYKDEASVLTVTYQLDSETSSDAETEVVTIAGMPTCWEGRLPLPPAASPHDTDTIGPSCTGTESMSSPGSMQTFQHTFILEFPAGQAAESDLQVQLLGPWSGRVGEVVAMSWQVTRLSAASKSQGALTSGTDEMVYFEVAQDSSHWYCICQGKGMLRLGRHAGSVATVEAVVVPQVAGTCPPPGLNLRGVSISASDAYSQEVFIHAA